MQHLFVLLALIAVATIIPLKANATNQAGKAPTTWGKIKAGVWQSSEREISAAPKFPSKVKNGIYYPQPGHPGWGYFLYIRPMAGKDSGIEIFLLPLGIAAGAGDRDSVRLAIWTLLGYYEAGGSKQDFPYNVEYVSSIANEIKLHCLASFLESISPVIARSANPINIEKKDHPGYKVSEWQAIRDWKNGIF